MYIVCIYFIKIGFNSEGEWEGAWVGGDDWPLHESVAQFKVFVYNVGDHVICVSWHEYVSEQSIVQSP